MDGLSAPGDQGRVQSPSAITIQHPSYVRRNLWNTTDDSVLLARCSLSLSFFLALSPCLPLCHPSVHPPSRSIHCSLSRRTLSPRSLSQPPPAQVRGRRRITASSRGRLAPGNNPHGPSTTFLPTRQSRESYKCSSSPADEEVTSRDARAPPSEACVRFEVSVYLRSSSFGRFNRAAIEPW